MKKVTAIILAIMICALLCGCVPSQDYLVKKEQGIYPDAGDFPDTKWQCREADIYFYMLDYSENYIVGEYNSEGKSYRVVGSFDFDQMDLYLYSSTEVSPSDHEGFVRCERASFGHIYTRYSCENQTIVCDVTDSSVGGNEQIIPDTLTFDKVGNIAENSAERWYSEELDMYIESFDDAPGYYKGKITIDGIENYVHAFEIGNENYYMFSIENGKINNLKSGTSSPFVCMRFEFVDGQIIATVSDEVVSRPYEFEWTYENTTITFLPVE